MEQERKRKAWLYVIGVFSAVLIALIVLPAFQVRHEHPPKAVCNVRIRSLGIYCLVYLMEKGSWIDKNSWCDSVKSYVDEGTGERGNIYLCPNDKVGPCSYAMNENVPANTAELPDDLVILFESSPGWNQAGGADDVVTDRHEKRGAHIVFADGHVEFVEEEQIPLLKWKLDDEKE